MKLFFLFAISLSIYSVTYVPADAAPHAASAAQARQAIQAAYNAGNAAAARNDADGALKYLDADFVAVSKNGEESNMDVAYLRYRTIIEAAHNFHSRTTIQKLTMQDGGAVVVSHDHTSFTLVNHQTGQTAHCVSDGTSREFWMKTDQGWKEKRSKSLTDTEIVNGRRITEGA